MEDISARLAQLRRHCGLSQAAAADILGVSRRSYHLYEKGARTLDNPKLQKLAAHYGVSLDWLMLGIDPPEVTPSQNALPVVGFARCGMNDWFAATEPLALTTHRPHDLPDQDAFAIIANGNSLVPEGVRPGFLCLCSPATSQQEGDIVFVRDNQGKASLKVFIKEDADWIWLRGYLPADDTGHQPPYIDQRKKSHINQIATVVYVKRRV